MKVLKILQANRVRLLYGTLIFLIAGFAVLSFLVITFPPSAIDLYISEELQERDSALLREFMIWVSWFGNIPVSPALVCLTAGAFLFRHYKREAFFVLLSLLSGVISTGLKALIDRPRPTAEFVTIIEKANYQSFPSGHTLFYTVFFGFLIIIMGNLKSLNRYFRLIIAFFCLSMILLVPVSRVYLGAHWFTDVLGGFMLGIICLYALGYFYLLKPVRGIK